MYGELSQTRTCDNSEEHFKTLLKHVEEWTSGLLAFLISGSSWSRSCVITCRQSHGIPVTIRNRRRAAWIFQSGNRWGKKDEKIIYFRKSISYRSFRVNKRIKGRFTEVLDPFFGKKPEILPLGDQRKSLHFPLVKAGLPFRKIHPALISSWQKFSMSDGRRRVFFFIQYRHCFYHKRQENTCHRTTTQHLVGWRWNEPAYPFGQYDPYIFRRCKASS